MRCSFFMQISSVMLKLCVYIAATFRIRQPPPARRGATGCLESAFLVSPPPVCPALEYPPYQEITDKMLSWTPLFTKKAPKRHPKMPKGRPMGVWSRKSSKKQTWQSGLNACRAKLVRDRGETAEASWHSPRLIRGDSPLAAKPEQDRTESGVFLS